LIAWRVVDGPLSETPLIVSKTIPDEELRALQRSIRPDSIIVLEAKLCEPSPFGDARAELVRLLDAQAVPGDPDLERVLADSVAPVEFSDSVLGRLILNRLAGWFEGNVVWQGGMINLALSAAAEIDRQAAVQTAKVLLDSMLEWSQQVNNLAVSKLLSLKNECWLDEDEQEISSTEFLNRMQLKSITVYPDGSVDFWHDDGDLFWGHSILVTGSLSDGVTDASIAG
jgi:hypothetical protein